MTLYAIKADITSLKVDAIVNSANPALIAGGGVCGAIHKAAGSELEKVCREIGKCEVGSAVITPAFNLPSQYVIHAVGPRWLDGQRGEPDLLRRCYESIFSLTLEHQITSLAIPSISTGIYHYPLDAAVEAAVEVARQFDRENLTIIFACFDDATLETYQKHLGG
jgi:O-acetyl-ADP-ribose deacetylase (regulator of RNase III)